MNLFDRTSLYQTYKIYQKQIILVLISACLICQNSTSSASEISASEKSSAETGATEMSHYIKMKDDAYQWKLVDTQSTEKGNAYFIHFASQTWLTPKDIDRTLWRHWMVVYVPKRLKYQTALLYISGKNNTDDYRSFYAPRWFDFAEESEAVIAEVFNIPNQPFLFKEDPAQIQRTEDELLSFGWAQYYKTQEAHWLPHLPMVKSAIRAMDTVQSFCQSASPVYCQIQQFILSGKSKRGWTTYLTATQDQRVIGIAPMVFDVLNFTPHLQHHIESYGHYSPAMKPYEDQKLLETQGTKGFQAVAAIIDPYSYRHQLTCPKMAIHATGDRFFPPDSAQFYWHDFVGDKHLRYIPNTDHSLNQEAYTTLLTFFESLTQRKPLPTLNWQIHQGKINIQSNRLPSKIKVWQARNQQRDFRFQATQTQWQEKEFTQPHRWDETNQQYHYEWAPEPSTDFFQGNLVELTYENPKNARRPIILTTEVWIQSPTKKGDAAHLTQPPDKPQPSLGN